MKLPRFSIDDETRRTIDETKNKALLQADRALRPLPYRAASSVARKVIFRKKKRGAPGNKEN